VKLLLNAQWPEHHLGPLKESFPQVEFVEAGDQAALLREIADADAVFGRVTEEMYQASSKLRWVQAQSAGVEWIWDAPSLQASDVVLTNFRGAHAQTIAEHAFGMLLYMTRSFPALLEAQKKKIWMRPVEPRPTGLSGLTLGIIGLGNIGRAMAKRGAGFDMNVIAVDINEVPKPDYVSELRLLDGLPDLLQRADAVMIATPLSPTSRGMIGADELALMKPTSHLMVMSRGKIVDETALVAALKEKWIAGAGLDVQAVEPMPADDPLWDAPNTIISPHSSGQSEQTWTLGTGFLRENLTRFLAGEELVNLVDKSRGY
jgi:phosphoglycerate dehydrogenase-like enzyme